MDKKDPLERIIRFDFLLIATPRYPRVAPVFCPVPIRLDCCHEIVCRQVTPWSLWKMENLCFTDRSFEG